MPGTWAKRYIKAKDRWLDLCDQHPRLEQACRLLERLTPPVNFITIHYTYFTAIIVVGSVVFWASSRPLHSVSYVDSLFIVTSAITNTGLATFNLSEVTVWQQVFLWLLFILGSQIWISFWTVMFRKHAFEHRFEDIVDKEREQRKRIAAERKTTAGGGRFSLRRSNAFAPGENTGSAGRPTFSRPWARRRTSNEGAELDDIPEKPGQDASPPALAITSSGNGSSDTEVGPLDSPSHNARDHISFGNLLEPARSEGRASAYDHGQQLTPRNRRSSASIASVASEEDDFLLHWKQFLTKHNVSRSGQVFDLSSEERERLGGTEYRALKILAFMVPLYAFLWQFLGAMALGAWFNANVHDPDRVNGSNTWWTGIHLGVSAFTNTGLALIDDSLVPFQGDFFPLFVVGLLILAGNTAYPIFLRLILWTCLQVLNLITPPASHAPLKETLGFILQYPRRVYTTLFPARATWWLTAVLFIVNIIDWLAFELLNINNPAVEDLTVAERIIGGLFQAISVRAAGFVIISISSLYIGLQVLYFIMMYISVYPVVITMRNSNVYEERSIGIYEDDPSAVQRYEAETASVASDTHEPSRRQFLRRRGTGAALGKTLRSTIMFNGVGAVRKPKAGEEPSPVSFIGQQIRAQLAHDLWWLVLAVLIIIIIETDHFNTDPQTHSVFNVLFEAVSAYGCVGLSVGLPDQSYSYSGTMHVASKVVMVAVMLRGRHRGLPVAVDRAVRLPGEKLQKEEEEDVKIRRSKTLIGQGISISEV